MADKYYTNEPTDDNDRGATIYFAWFMNVNADKQPGRDNKVCSV
jgi:hypothetical protein